MPASFHQRYWCVAAIRESANINAKSSSNCIMTRKRLTFILPDNTVRLVFCCQVKGQARKHYVVVVPITIVVIVSTKVDSVYKDVQVLTTLVLRKHKKFRRNTHAVGRPIYQMPVAKTFQRYKGPWFNWRVQVNPPHLRAVISQRLKIRQSNIHSVEKVALHYSFVVTQIGSAVPPAESDIHGKARPLNWKLTLTICKYSSKAYQSCSRRGCWWWWWPRGGGGRQSPRHF